MTFIRHFLYYLLRLTLTVTFRVFFKKIHVIGEDKIPANQPIILASTHPNSFLDGVVLMALLHRTTYTLARGDAFLKPTPNRILRSMNLLPIFRATDGDPRESIQRNNHMFDEVYDILNKKRMVIIFPEANAIHEKRVRPLKKGTARMAVDMIKRSNFEMNLAIVPVGMNYSFFKSFRKEMHIKIGEPILMREEAAEIRDAEARYVNHLTKRLSEAMEAQMIIAADGKDDEFDTLADLIRKNTPESFFVHFDRSDTRFQLEKELSNRLLQKQDEKLYLEAKSYREMLENHQLKEYPRYSTNQVLWQNVFCILSFVPATIVWLFHGFGIYFAKKMTPNKIKTPVFFDSVFLGILMIALDLAALFFFMISYVFFGWGGMLVYWMCRWLIPVFYSNEDYLSDRKEARKWTLLSKSNPEIFTQLIEKRRYLLEAIA
jgi:1-acyl-sn-glycerol-3-phosphate acyltransferase